MSRANWSGHHSMALLAAIVLSATSVMTMTGAATGTVVPVTPTPMCHGHRATIVGTSGRDVIRGTTGPDVILARGGADDIRGRGGDDIICGGAGNDLIRGGWGNDLVLGGRGADRILGEGGDDVLLGQSGHDRLSGGNGCDQLWGGPGNDHLDGGSTINCHYRPLYGQRQPLYHTDFCRQGPGTGALVDCEGTAIADLAITSISSPAEVTDKMVTVSVTVHNDGPDAVPHVQLRGTSTFWSIDGYLCGQPSAMDPDPLDAGASRTYDLTFTCLADLGSFDVNLIVRSIHAGLDRDSSNNMGSTWTHVD